MNKSYFFSETAFHHEGDMEYMLDLIRLSSEIGVDGVKFQVLIEPSDFLSECHSAFEQLRGYCFGFEEWNKIFKETTKLGLDIILMPLDLSALNLLHHYPVKFIDIHSVSFHDTALLDQLKTFDVPVVLGVGGRALEEIEEKQDFFGQQLKGLLVGFQSFPSDIKDVKLQRIGRLKALFPKLSIGYADHSAFDDPWAVKSCEYARLLGATIFEKHLTLGEGKPRTDYESAISGDTMKDIMAKVRFIDEFVLEEERLFDIEEPELTYRQRAKQVVATKDLRKGGILKEEDLTLRMIDKKNGYIKADELIGKKLKKDTKKHDILSNSDFE
ncbi:MAG: N-acetylneuraminate synthase family protein [Bacteroidota bacterium]